jgi:hypothetical protein
MYCQKAFGLWTGLAGVPGSAPFFVCVSCAAVSRPVILFFSRARGCLFFTPRETPRESGNGRGRGRYKLPVIPGKAAGNNKNTKLAFIYW